VGWLRVDEQLVHRGDRHVLDQAEVDAQPDERTTNSIVSSDVIIVAEYRVPWARDTLSTQHLAILTQHAVACGPLVGDDLRNDP